MEHYQVYDAQSFAKYVEHLRTELENPDRARSWENVDLSSFLEAMASWATAWSEAFAA